MTAVALLTFRFPGQLITMTAHARIYKIKKLVLDFPLFNFNNLKSFSAQGTTILYLRHSFRCPVASTARGSRKARLPLATPLHDFCCMRAAVQLAHIKRQHCVFCATKCGGTCKGHRGRGKCKRKYVEV